MKQKVRLAEESDTPFEIVENRNRVGVHLDVERGENSDSATRLYYSPRV